MSETEVFSLIEEWASAIRNKTRGLVNIDERGRLHRIGYGIVAICYPATFVKGKPVKSIIDVVVKEGAKFAREIRYFFIVERESTHVDGSFVFLQMYSYDKNNTACRKGQDTKAISRKI